MKGLTVKDIAGIVGGRLLGDGGDREPTGLVIDSRQVQPGLGFAALPGEHTDGHAFIGKAFDAGASFCLAEHVPEGEHRAVITVADVAEAITKLAIAYRSRFSIPVVGVTGSVGKTTAKEMISCVLSQKYNTHSTEKNYNNELGVPLTIFRMEPEHEAAVIEMGISHFGEMTRLARMAKPTMAVFTIIGRSHLEFLGDRDGVLLAKGEMLSEMDEDAPVFVNGDDDLLVELQCPQEIIRFGLGRKCDVRAENIRTMGEAGSECDVVCEDRRIPVRIPAYGKHLVYAALAAAAVGMRLGLSDAQIAAGIAAYTPVGRRARVVETDSLTMIDDCYNANPDSAASAIDSASDLGGRLVCIFGDMLELGDKSVQLHRLTGRLALSRGAVLLTTGEMARYMGGQHFESREALIQALPSILHHGDRVLVKASNSMNFGEISEALKTLVL